MNDVALELKGPQSRQLRRQFRQFQFQRRLMSGGTCEATPLNLYGYRTSAMAVPLVNYHNQGSHGPAPEMISLRDTEMAREFCAALALKLSHPTLNTERLLKRILKDYRLVKDLLKTEA
jgi:endoglucanase